MANHTVQIAWMTKKPSQVPTKKFKSVRTALRVVDLFAVGRSLRFLVGEEFAVSARMNITARIQVQHMLPGNEERLQVPVLIHWVCDISFSWKYSAWYHLVVLYVLGIMHELYIHAEVLVVVLYY